MTADGEGIIAVIVVVVIEETIIEIEIVIATGIGIVTVSVIEDGEVAAVMVVTMIVATIETVVAAATITIIAIHCLASVLDLAMGTTDKEMVAMGEEVVAVCESEAKTSGCEGATTEGSSLFILFQAARRKRRNVFQY
jgi:hypothetical protein